MKHRIAHQFGLQAKRYNQVSEIQEALADRVAALCPEFLGSVLDVGAGTGHLALRMAQRNAQNLHLLDLSSAMLEQARAHLMQQYPHLPVLSHVTDAEAYTPTDKFQTLVSSAALQWFHNPQDFIKRAYHWQSPNGILAIGSFGALSFQEIAQAYQRVIGQELITGTQAINAQDLKIWFENAGYMDIQVHSEILVQTWESPRQLLRHLKSMGVTGVHNRPMLKRSQLQALESALVQANGQVQLTWELTWGCGRRSGECKVKSVE